MMKNSKKRTRPATKVNVEPKSNASVYATMLARQLAAEMTPARTSRKSKAAR